MVGCRLGQTAGVQFEYMKQFLADGTALPTESVVHPEPLTAGIDPAAALEVGQMARHGRLGQPQHRHQVTDAQFTFGLKK